jgi:beta-galactosidase beta subunit
MILAHLDNAGRDDLPLTGDGDFVTLAAGPFALIMPHDPHLPHPAAGDPGPGPKIVIEIAVA